MVQKGKKEYLQLVELVHLVDAGYYMVYTLDFGYFKSMRSKFNLN
jgi:hypothetical protein